MDTKLKRAFTCYRRESGKHMMRLMRTRPWITYRCEACRYMFQPGEERY